MQKLFPRFRFNIQSSVNINQGPASTGPPKVFGGESILNGRRKSILEVGQAIRTGVRLGSITKDTALNSKILQDLPDQSV